MYIGHFSDKAAYDADTKTAISIRDGVLEYAGVELNPKLGLDPSKTYTVYRSPATIAQAAEKMIGMAVTLSHVSESAADSESIGVVETATIVDFFDEATDSKLAIKHKIKMSELPSDKELSWDYDADLVKHHTYDFEQKNIEPKRLAVVEAGRCGSACSFLDHKPDGVEEMKNKFLDADGKPNLSDVVETAQALPEAIKMLPLDKVAEIMPLLMEIVATANSVLPEEEKIEEPEGEAVEVADEDEGEKMKASDAEDDEDEEKKDFSDSAVFKDAVASATKSALKAHGEAIEKATGFVDESYSYADKDTAQIMRDALAVEHGDTEFTDADLGIAFKMLKKSNSSLSKFAAKESAMKTLADKEL